MSRPGTRHAHHATKARSKGYPNYRFLIRLRSAVNGLQQKLVYLYCYIIEDLSLGPRRAHNPKATRGGTKRVLTRPLSQHRAAEQQASTNKLSNSALVRLTKKLMHVGIQVGNNDCVRNAEIVKEVREPRSNGVVMGAFENEVGFILNYLHVAMEAKAILSRDPRRPAPCDDPKVMTP